jgi:protein TonB
LNDPRVDLVAVEESEPAAREKQLEVLGAVTAPNLTPVENVNFTVDPVPAKELAGLPQAGEARQPEPLPFRFLGYDDSLSPEPEPAPAATELLGEYLSKWDIVVIFGAVLIAMIAFSAWIHHRRAQANQPYVAQYAQDDQTPATTTQPASTEPSANSNSKAQPKSHNTQTKAKPIPISGGASGLELKPPPVRVANSEIPKTPPLSVVADPSAAVSGPTAPAELVHKVSPLYPTNPRAATEGQTVTLDLKVGTDGKVGMIKVVDGSNPFVSSALNAVRQWRYEPAVQNGKKIESFVRVEIPFDSNSR